MRAKNRTPIFTLLFCKDNIVKKRQLRFDIAKAALLRCKTYVFVLQLILEKEEKSKLV